jgi:hypothetical protein
MRIGLGGMALAAVASLACGRLKPAASDAGPPATPDANVPGADGAGQTPDDATPSDALSTDATPLPLDAASNFPTVPRAGRALPSDVRPPARFADASALLVGNGRDACTHQTPASGDGDRWCAFTLGRAGGLADLWVIDVTRAATGNVPPCDGSDAGCLHLTNKVVTSAAIFFDGDTLFYGTHSTAAPATDFLGRIFAWRPGWSAGRQVSSDAGFTCIGNVRSAAAACLDDPGGDPRRRDSANVRAGYLATQAGDALPTFGRYPLRNDNDTAWQAALSPDGSVFALSDADTIGATQTLRLALTSQVGQATPTQVLDDVFGWQISNDGQKIYFLRGANQQPDLFVADFPSGANATLVETGIKAFTFIGNRPSDQAVEIAKIRQPGGTIELLTDRTLPARTIFNYDDFLNGAVVSPDLRYTTWLNDNFRAVVFRNSDLSTCTINESSPRETYDPSYLDGASLMFWKEPLTDHPTNDLRDGYFAPPERCGQKTRFARNVDRIAPIGDLGLVFTDEVDQTTRATLKYIAVAPDTSTLDPAGAVRVHESVAPPVVLVGQNPPLLVYPATGPTPETSGLFVFGPVPF